MHVIFAVMMSQPIESMDRMIWLSFKQYLVILFYKGLKKHSDS